jgi:hypothetical protein
VASGTFEIPLLYLEQLIMALVCDVTENVIEEFQVEKI